MIFAEPGAAATKITPRAGVGPSHASAEIGLIRDMCGDAFQTTGRDGCKEFSTDGFLFMCSTETRKAGVFGEDGELVQRNCGGQEHQQDAISVVDDR